MDAVNHQRRPPGPGRHPQPGTLYWRARVQPPPLSQTPGHRPSLLGPEPARRLAARTRAGVAHDRTVEDRVLAGVRRHLLAPEAIASAVRIFHEERSARRLEALAARAPAERELSEIDRKLERAQMMFMKEMITMDELEARMAPLKTRRTELEVLIATSPSPGRRAASPRRGRGLPPPGGDPAPGDQRRRRRRPAARVAQVDRDRGVRAAGRLGQVRAARPRPARRPVASRSQGPERQKPRRFGRGF